MLKCDKRTVDRRQNTFLPGLSFWLMFLANGALAQSQTEEEPWGPLVLESTDTLEEQALEEVQTPFTPLRIEAHELPDETGSGQVSPLEDPCLWDLEEGEFQEDWQELMRGLSCYSFRWFDGLFGDEVDYPEEQVNGLLTIGGAWEQYDGFDSRVRLRVRAPLPNMDNRFDLILGRGDDEAFIEDTETQNEVFYNPGLVNRGQEDSWLLGLGARTRGGHKGWNWSAGVRLRTPPVPYLKGQWFYYKQFGDAADLRFRQTFFWRSDDGFGTTSRGDYAWAVNTDDVLRLEGVVTYSEVTLGTQWFVGHTWYHLLGERSAFSLLSFAEGETNAEVSLREFGFRFVWRRPFTRDWMYLSVGPTITWPRFFETEKREASLGFGAWIELEFGDWIYR